MSCPTLPFFSVRDRTIGVGLCYNLANEQIKVSFYQHKRNQLSQTLHAKLNKIFSSAYKVV